MNSPEQINQTIINLQCIENILSYTECNPDIENLLLECKYRIETMQTFSKIVLENLEL